MKEMLSCHQFHSSEYSNRRKNPIVSALYECYEFDPSNTLEEVPKRSFKSIHLLQYTLSHYGKIFQDFSSQFTDEGELLDNILKFGNWCDINHTDEQDNTKEFIRNENILLKAISKSLKRSIILYPVTQ